MKIILNQSTKFQFLFYSNILFGTCSLGWGFSVFLFSLFDWRMKIFGTMYLYISKKFGHPLIGWVKWSNQNPPKQGRNDRQAVTRCRLRQNCLFPSPHQPQWKQHQSSTIRNFRSCWMLFSWKRRTPVLTTLRSGTKSTASSPGRSRWNLRQGLVEPPGQRVTCIN